MTGVEIAENKQVSVFISVFISVAETSFMQEIDVILLDVGSFSKPYLEDAKIAVTTLLTSKVRASTRVSLALPRAIYTQLYFSSFLD